MRNKVELIGRVGQKDIRYMPDGNPLASYSIATTESYRDKNTGEWKEKTEWHRCVSFNKAAEHIGEKIDQGDLLLIEGKLQTRKWQTTNGEDRYTTEIVVHHFPKKLPKYYSKYDSQQAHPTSEALRPQEPHPPHHESPPVTAYGDIDDLPL